MLYADGTEINRFRSPSLDPVAPSGTGSDVSFQTSWSGGLGNHEFRLVLDPMKNLTQAREDNDAYETTLSILPPFNATISIPSTPTRVDPGAIQRLVRISSPQEENPALGRLASMDLGFLKDGAGRMKRLVAYSPSR